MKTITVRMMLGMAMLVSCLNSVDAEDLPFAAGIDRLMNGGYCADCGTAECTQIELAAADELLGTQLRQVAGALPAGEQASTSLYAAQAAWERYRDLQCSLLVMHESEATEAQQAIGARCRLELTVERMLDLADLQDKLASPDWRVVHLH